MEPRQTNKKESAQCNSSIWKVHEQKQILFMMNWSLMWFINFSFNVALFASQCSDWWGEWWGSFCQRRTSLLLLTASDSGLEHRVPSAHFLHSPLTVSATAPTAQSTTHMHKPLASNGNMYIMTVPVVLDCIRQSAERVRAPCALQVMPCLLSVFQRASSSAPSLLQQRRVVSSSGGKDDGV